MCCKPDLRKSLGFVLQDVTLFTRTALAHMAPMNRRA